MEAKLVQILQHQVLLQCQFLVAAAREVNWSLEEKNPPRTFFALQNLLNAGANISKALWGQCGRLAAERKPLRDSVGVSDNSPLREVTMRNNFEHFDERLDRWWRESKGHAYIDLNIGAQAIVSSAADIDKFRHFDPITANIIFWGQEFNLQSIATAAEEIIQRLSQEADQAPQAPAEPKPQA